MEQLSVEISIGHFRITFAHLFKTRPSNQPFVRMRFVNGLKKLVPANHASVTRVFPRFYQITFFRQWWTSYYFSLTVLIVSCHYCEIITTTLSWNALWCLSPCEHVLPLFPKSFFHGIPAALLRATGAVVTNWFAQVSIQTKATYESAEVDRPHKHILQDSTRFYEVVWSRSGYALEKN